MDTPNVSELLRQLEDLKRKRAERIEVLKKLGKPTKEVQKLSKDKCPTDLSCSKSENPQHIGKYQNSAKIKCCKCGHRLNSVNESCIQCTRVKYNENKYEVDFRKPNIFNSDFNICMDKKSSFQDCNKNTSSKPLSKSSNQGFQNSSRLSRKQRKRVSIVKDNLTEATECDSKKFKQSKENEMSASIYHHNNSFSRQDIVVKGKKIFSINEKEKSQTEGTLNKSLLPPNTTCSLSLNLLLGEDNDAHSENLASQLHSLNVNESSSNQSGNILESTTHGRKDILSLSSSQSVLKDFKHLEMKRTLRSKLFSSFDAHCGSPVKDKSTTNFLSDMKCEMNGGEADNEKSKELPLCSQLTDNLNMPHFNSLEKPVINPLTKCLDCTVTASAADKPKPFPVEKCDEIHLEDDVYQMFLDGDDSWAADVDLECTSLEVSDNRTVTSDTEITVPNSEAFTQEQEVVAPISNNLEKIDVTPFSETQCDSLYSLQKVQDIPLLNKGNSLELKIKNILFLENEKKNNSSVLEELPEDEETNLKLVCCLHNDIAESVADVKFVFFNNSNYLFIQQQTWIQVWKQEGSEDWIRICNHQVDKVKLKRICLSKDDRYLILVMLLCSEQVHSLQFLLFEKEMRVIKLLERIHSLQNRNPEENILLCGLDDLRFATANGEESFVYFLYDLGECPRLRTTALVSANGRLHSLIKVEKLPNVLLCASDSSLYLWHYLEDRLMTSVILQPLELITIESCIWATIENDLIFLMAICEDKNTSQVCQLLAANPVTGSFEIAQTYSFLPSINGKYTTNKNLKAVYNEPILAASCKDRAFLWSATNEYCSAAVNTEAGTTAADMTTIAIGPISKDLFLVALGSSAGCVNCYGLEFS